MFSIFVVCSVAWPCFQLLATIVCCLYSVIHCSDGQNLLNKFRAYIDGYVCKMQSGIGQEKISSILLKAKKQKIKIYKFWNKTFNMMNWRITSPLWHYGHWASFESTINSSNIQNVIYPYIFNTNCLHHEKSFIHHSLLDRQSSWQVLEPNSMAIEYSNKNGIIFNLSCKIRPWIATNWWFLMLSNRNDRLQPVPFS